ncbi:NADH-quinone oxidoreductase subunit J [Pigmentiphaga sp.]|uniref:NADH-quinone oxidoreductase subunit J n=1 Tax=Pigmentiphaga sp. TaxID=1977564 RepID=UPI00128DB62B|nr:NADH-quinone oxidoreductase subunit J [Pigmentiphaga sp.]MPS28480.1 NADH-quinone oxidoreductase subunit J [Alcaligenaceae bacterium SAGV5]MPS52145.1 NADH-quinone oxidoreductase subunit J [Alcaligenaceae bacterium SAGV3]MPT56301.1 NADH-quinone oxidoreductase subunit J [Alcaligenaceae bacterium]
MTAILFYIFAAILVVAACRVIVARSPVTAVMHLVLSFFTASMIWMLLKAEFLAILLVLVYVGAVMVLFLFVVMMLDIDSAKLRQGFKSYLPLGILVGVIMVGEMAFVLANAYWDTSVPQAPADFNNTRAIGVAMYTEYIYAVEIAAVILLVGMVAAIALTLRRRSDVKVTRSSEQIRVRRQDRVRLVSIPSQTENSQEGGSAQAPAATEPKGSQS